VSSKLVLQRVFVEYCTRYYEFNGNYQPVSPELKGKKASISSFFMFGGSGARVKNTSAKPLFLAVFNHADNLYQTPHRILVLDPGKSVEIEAQAHLRGIKVALLFSANIETHEAYYKLWSLQNEATLTVSYINGSDILGHGEVLFTKQ
jgi:hypothetical protein